MLLNCSVGEDSWESLGLQGDPTRSILKEISPGCSLDRMMLKLKLQYFGHLMWRVDSLEKILMLGGIGGRRKRGWQRMRWLDSITNSMNVSLSNSGSWWWTGRPGMLQFMGSQRVRYDWTTELNSKNGVASWSFKHKIHINMVSFFSHNNFSSKILLLVYYRWRNCRVFSPQANKTLNL